MIEVDFGVSFMMNDNGKELIDLLLMEVSNYNKYWITEGIGDFDHKSKF